MPPKNQLYLTLCDQLIPYFSHDAQTMEADPEKWKLARELDDFLVKFMWDDRVKMPQYERVAKRLLALYVDVPAAVRGEAAS